jgi:hypothetical protein
MRHGHLAGLLLALLALGAHAGGKHVKYAGVHPRTGKPDGGLCYVQAVHVHSLAPSSADVLYRMHNGVYFFIGDPVPFGYDGPRHSYYGHHPVTVNVVLEEEGPDDVAFCYLDGPHFHHYAPPPRTPFTTKENVAYYTGDYPESYEKEKPKLVRVNTVYKPIHYERPVVVEAPPAAYRGPLVDVRVHLPVPAVHVQVGAPPPVILVNEHVHVKHKHHKHKKHKWKH